MGVIDLDAARAARNEEAGDPPQIIFGGQTFTAPLELSLEAGEALGREDARGFIRELLGDDWEDFLGHKPTLKDLEVLSNSLALEYGFADPGESSASSTSSRKNGKRSKRTSGGTTSSDSAKSPGVPSA